MAKHACPSQLPIDQSTRAKGPTGLTLPQTTILITLRLPRASAGRLNLALGETDGGELTTTLTAVELAGRLSLATGRCIGPDAVVAYCAAWRAARECLAGLVEKHGRTGVASIVRKACKDRTVWAPSRNVAMLDQLQCVLEAYFVSEGSRGHGVPTPGAYAAEQQEAQDDVRAPEPESAPALAGICEAILPLAYRLWTVTVT